MPAGAPRKHDRKKILLQILDIMSEGHAGALPHASNQLGVNPGLVYLWTTGDTDEAKELYDILQRAQEAWCYAQAAKIIEIADDDSKDILETTESYTTKSGEVKTYTRLTSDNTPVNRADKRIRARQWAMTKLAKKLFGDVIENQVTGKDGERLNIIVNVTPKSKND